jgi:hypothetical protein
MAGTPIAASGVNGPVVVTSNAFTGQHTVTVGGQPIPRGKGGTYQLPSSDGGSVEAKVSSSFFNPSPTLQVAGKKYASGPPLPIVLQILMLLPLGLVFVGGLIGGLIGALGVGVNTLVARSNYSTIVKVLMMLGILVAAIIIWVGVVQVISRTL